MTNKQALRLVKADLEETKKAKAALEAESETKEATIATLQSKVRTHTNTCLLTTRLGP